jgi:DNA-binding transcriptional LysR family regulator
VGKSFEPTVSVSSFDAACRMVEAGLGIAVMPRSAAAAYAGSERFVRRPLDESWAGRILNVYAMRKTPQPRAVAALIESLKG